MTVPDETLASLGESAVLRRIFPRLPDAASALLGPGDDAAVVAAPDGRFVVTTDTLVHGPDFRLAWSSAFQLGWKAAASNLADVAAMGARPTALVVALVAPADTDVRWLEEFADGLREGCAALAPGCGVVGGDLSVSDQLTIAVTAFGDLEGRRVLLVGAGEMGEQAAKHLCKSGAALYVVNRSPEKAEALLDAFTAGAFTRMMAARQPEPPSP